HTRCYRDWSSDVCSSDLCRLLELDATWSFFRSQSTFGGSAFCHSHFRAQVCALLLASLNAILALDWLSMTASEKNRIERRCGQQIGRASCRERGRRVECG